MIIVLNLHTHDIHELILLPGHHGRGALAAHHHHGAHERLLLGRAADEAPDAEAAVQGALLAPVPLYYIILY